MERKPKFKTLITDRKRGIKIWELYVSQREEKERANYEKFEKTVKLIRNLNPK